MKSDKIKQKVYEKLINNKIYEKIDKDLSEDKLNIILKDLEDNCKYTNEYMSNDLSLEQIKAFSELSHNIKDIDDIECYRNMKYITKCKWIKPEQIKALTPLMKSYNIQKYLKEEYTPEQIKIYAKWENKRFIYNFDLHMVNRKIDEKMANHISKVIHNIDKSLPIKEQDKIFKNEEKEYLLKLANDEIDIDTKIVLNKLINELDKENIEIVEEQIER